MKKIIIVGEKNINDLQFKKKKKIRTGRVFCQAKISWVKWHLITLEERQGNDIKKWIWKYKDMLGNKPKWKPKNKIEDLSCLTSKLNITDDTLNKG